MRFIWPPLDKALETRKNKIAAGLAAAEEGEQKLFKARQEAEHLRKEALSEAQQILEQAEKRRVQILEEVRLEAQALQGHILKEGRARIQEETLQARRALEEEVVDLLELTCVQLLGREVKLKDHQHLLNQLGVSV